MPRKAIGLRPTREPKAVTVDQIDLAIRFVLEQDEFPNWNDRRLRGARRGAEAFTALFGSDGGALWRRHREVILRAWISNSPGTRPAHWWRYDAPRWALKDRPASIRDIDTFDCAEPRQRLGGTGTPIYEVLNYKPEFKFGVPATFDEADPDDPPPVYESQASYLKRHKLLEPDERRRLRAKDFEPIEIVIDHDDEDSDEEG